MFSIMMVKGKPWRSGYVSYGSTLGCASSVVGRDLNSMTMEPLGGTAVERWLPPAKVRQAWFLPTS